MARIFDYQPSLSGAGGSRRKHQAARQPSDKKSSFRSKFILAVLYLLMIGVTARLFYWQVIHRTRLQEEAENQYRRTITHLGQRGKILTSDGYALATNSPVYRLFAQPHLLKKTPLEMSETLAPLLVDITPEVATQPAMLAKQREDIKSYILERLNLPDRKWIALQQRVTNSQKQAIEELKITGIGFEEYFVRDYPEASTAAHVLGFVGKNQEGEDQGYFGVEGALDKELRGQADKQTFNKDALGFHLFFDQLEETPVTNGRDVVLTLRRDVQHTVEESLKAGIEKYGAVEGEVIVIEPQTGKILALAAFPNYEPEFFYKYPPETHKNPLVTDLYEPGSTFKVLTVSAGIDTKSITEDTLCTKCDHARKINEYTIKTWNDQYNSNINMKDALAKSDNTAMIFIAELLGEQQFVDYVKKFGIGEATNVELQEDVPTPFRKDWKFIDLATSSFGQGIATTGLQMTRAVAAIANDGKMMRPTIVEKVIDHQQGKEILVQPVEERQVIDAETAKRVAAMMEYAASSGEAKWTRSKTHSVAGKTGTAQIPIAGHYDDDKTIASFIGFSPVENPRFVMLVKLREPQSSPWAAETAAPLWYSIANKLYLLLNVPADRQG
jgi:cell division protein FtsI (penicillin-binding protein 3)